MAGGILGLEILAHNRLYQIGSGINGLLRRLLTGTGLCSVKDFESFVDRGLVSFKSGKQCGDCWNSNDNKPLGLIREGRSNSVICRDHSQQQNERRQKRNERLIVLLESSLLRSRFDSKLCEGIECGF